MGGLGLVCATACSVGQTKPIDVDGVQDTRAERARAEALAARLAASVVRRGADIAVGATETGLSGVPLGGGSTWRYTHVIDSVPFIAGDVIIGEGEGSLFALAASDGHLLWQRPSGGRRVRGAGDDGATTVVCLEPLADPGSALLAIDRSGRVLRQIETEHEIGHPAVVGNVALLPFRGRWVSGFDIALGTEIGRFSLPERATHVVVLAGAAYAAEASFLRLDRTLSTPLSSRIRPPLPVFAPAVRWLPSALERHPVTGAVRDRTLAFAQLAPPPAPARLVDDRAYLATRRLVFAMNAPPDVPADVRWIYTHGAEVLAGAAFSGGIALCDTDGMITLLDRATGQKVGRLSLEGRVTTCAIQADALTRVSSEEPPAPLDQQVGELFAREDPALVSGKRDMLRYLASRALDAETTRILVDLATGDTARGVEADLDAALTTRSVGADYLLAGLRRATEATARSTTRATTWSPLGALAEALADLLDRRATPLLLRALLEPTTPVAALPRVAAAVEALAGETDVDALMTFVDRRFRTKSDESEDKALVHIARTLLRVGAVRGRAQITKLADDSLTPDALRSTLTALLTAPPASKAPLLFVTVLVPHLGSRQLVVP
jgi:hypothetical protein